MASNNIRSCSNNINNFHFHTSSFATCWDLLRQHYLPNLGFLDSNFSPYYNGIEEMSYVTPSSSMMSSYVGDDHNTGISTGDDQHLMSTGYLEDALNEFSVRFKRRRLQFSDDDDDDVTNHFPHFTYDELSYLREYWTSDNNMQLEEELSHDSLLSHDLHYSSLGEDRMEIKKIEGMKRKKEEELIETNPELLLEQTIISSDSNSSRKFLEASPSNSKEMMKGNPNNFTFYSPSFGFSASTPTETDEKEKRKVKRGRASDNSSTKMVYPFGLVKPGGSEGEITLKDINKRILMPPTRPLKHPVGNFACRPPPVLPYGPGLSGKAVVALTRIHTQGRGTITIIRTKG